MFKKILTMGVLTAGLLGNAQAEEARMFMYHGEFMEVADTSDKFKQLSLPEALTIVGYQLAIIELTATKCPDNIEAAYSTRFIIDSLPKISEFGKNAINAPLAKTSYRFWKQHRINNGCVSNTNPSNSGIKVKTIVERYKLPASRPTINGFIFALHDAIAITSCATVSPFQEDTSEANLSKFVTDLISTANQNPEFMNKNAALFFSYKLNTTIFKNVCNTLTA